MDDTIVEGVGDEVVWCLAGLFTVFLLVFTWFQFFRPIPAGSDSQTAEITTLPAEDEVASEADGPCDSGSGSGDNFEDVPVRPEAAEGVPDDTRQRRPEFFDGGSGEDGETPSGFPVRLKYLDDTERLVPGRSEETLGEFRRRHFGSELSQRRTVRLIFNGAVLRDDSASLSSCGIREGSVVHVHVSSVPSPEERVPTPSAEVDLGPGAYMWPLLATLLGAVWFLRFQYDQLFNASSTVLLLGMSGLFFVGLYGSRLPPPRRRAETYSRAFVQ